MSSGWLPANPFGIVAKGSVEHRDGNPVFTINVDPQFNAGPVNGIYRLSNGIVLLSTPTAGVWFHDPAKPSTCTALSQNWDRTSLTGLIRGIRDDHVYAIGGDSSGAIVWELSDASQISSWVQVIFPTQTTPNEQPIGIINAAIVHQGILFLACDNGVFYSVIPAPGTLHPLGYIFQPATVTIGASNVPKWSSIVLRPGSADSPLVAAAWKDGTGPALFDGVLSFGPNTQDVTLSLSPAQITGSAEVAALQQPFRVLLSSCDAPTSPVYAVIGTVDGAIGAFMVNPAGSLDWHIINTTSSGQHDALLQRTLTGTYESGFGAMVVNPTFTVEVSLAWHDAYFLSDDSGQTWKRVNAVNVDNLAPGLFAIDIDNSGESIFLGGQKGFFQSSNAGTTHSSAANERFANLVFENGDLEPPPNIGRIAGTISDDHGLRSFVVGRLNDDLTQHWKILDSALSQSPESVQWLRSGYLLNTSGPAGSADPAPQLRVFDTLGFEDPGTFLDPPIFSVPDGRRLRLWTPVKLPVAVGVADPPLVALALDDSNNMHGLLYGSANNVLTNANGEPPFTAEQLPFGASPGTAFPITALACPNERAIFAGTAFGMLRVMTILPGRNPAIGPYNTQVIDVSRDDPVTQICALPDDDNVFIVLRSGRLFVFSQTSTLVNSIDTINDVISVLSVPSQSQIFVTTHSGIFSSADGGQTWGDISSGLPSNIQPTSLRHIQEPGGASVLYIFTSGWSVWRKVLNISSLTTPRLVSLLKGTLSIRQHPHDSVPMPQYSAGNLMGSFRNLWTATHHDVNDQTAVELRIRFLYREGDHINGSPDVGDGQVEVIAGAFLNNFNTGHRGQSQTRTVILQPGDNVDLRLTFENQDNDNMEAGLTVSN